MPRSFFLVLCGVGVILAGCGSGQQAPTTVTQTVTAVPSSTTSPEPASTSEEPTTTQVTPVQEPQQTVVQQTTIYQAPPPAPAPAPTNNGVVGFTGAPTGAPQQLDKTIAYCMNDPSYQPGTTMFTDGTTGWTTYCAGM